MSIHPNPSFPLSAGDQADVIKLFLQLMSEADRSASAVELSTDTLVDWRNLSNDALFPYDPFDI
jgi:hypothetical protein